MRVILSGGGTAGHVYPALAVAEELTAGALESITYVGTPDSVEERLARDAGLQFISLPAQGFDRSKPLTLVTSSALLVASTLRALGMFRRTRPHVVVGFGGYVSIPVGVAAVLTRTPLVLHEQNSVPGLANRVLSRWARRVAVTYEESARYLKRPERATVTGNPVRPAVLQADRTSGRTALGLSNDAVTLLAFGGSRGSRHINRALVGVAAQLLSVPDVHVVHIAGRDETHDVLERLQAIEVLDSQRYHVLDYVDDMGSALAAADLVVSRAGATTLAELTALGKAAVLVPFPYATDDHQTTNASAVVEAGGAVMVRDAELDDEVFVETVTNLLADEDRRDRMAAASRSLGRPEAARLVAAVVRTAAQKETQ